MFSHTTLVKSGAEGEGTGRGKGKGGDCVMVVGRWTLL